MRENIQQSDLDGRGNALEARLLGKRYSRKWALRDCTFDIPIGRIAALVGPNGAGKTTLLHLGMGLLKPSSGSITVFGEEPSVHPLGVLPHVGFVAQDHPLYSGFSVADMLTFGRKMNTQWDDSLALARLRRLDIELNQRIGKLSGGQQAQVALALALSKRPKMLLLDEPVASLDPLARRDFLRTLVDASRERQITTLLSSHIVADLEQACDYLIILSASRVQLVGDIAQIRQSHHLLIGPRDDRAGVAALRERWDVMDESQSGQYTTLLARASSPDRAEANALPPGWRVDEAPLESIVLAYLGQSGAQSMESDSEQARYEMRQEVRR